jgi:hypothetical protein
MSVKRYRPYEIIVKLREDDVPIVKENASTVK